MKNFLFKIASVDRLHPHGRVAMKIADYYRGYVNGGSKGNPNGNWIRNTSNRLAPYALNQPGGLGRLVSDIILRRYGRGSNRQVNRGIYPDA